jgi:DHA2 family multidrug resistance protein-like MFS transporter
MLEFFWWGSVFLPAVPVTAVLLVVRPILLPEYRDPGRPDLASAALSLVAVLSVVWGLKRLVDEGVGVPFGVAIAAGPGLGAAFVLRQRRPADPPIDLDLVRGRVFNGSLTAYAFGIFLAFGLFLFTFQHLQTVALVAAVVALATAVLTAVLFGRGRAAPSETDTSFASDG